MRGRAPTLAYRGLWLLLLLLGSGCSQAPAPTDPAAEHRLYYDIIPTLTAVRLMAGHRLRVVATTSIVGDVVQNVGGDWIELRVLMPRGTDPHAFEPTPRDAAAVADAHVLFVNGVGLEAFLQPLLESAGEMVSVVPVSYGLELLHTEGTDVHKGEELHLRGEFDPHVWFDPQNVIIWTHNIERTLSALDPGNAEAYKANSEAYEEELRALDAWVDEQVARVPQEKRRLVTDHTSFTYLARRYGFEQVGAVFPGYSTLAAPSAQDVARLEDAIRRFEVAAVFVGFAVNPSLARRVADDTGTQLVYVYTGSLSEAGGPADTYLALMRHNTAAIVETLR